MSDFRRYVPIKEVEARQLTDDESVVTVNGVQAARKGDYAVRRQAGGLEVISQEEFEETYRTAAGSPKSGSKST